MSGFEILSSLLEFIYCAENMCPIQTVIEESWTQRLWQDVGKSQGNQRNSGIPGRPERGAVSSQAQGESRWVEKVLDSSWGLWKRNTANRQLPGGSSLWGSMSWLRLHSFLFFSLSLAPLIVEAHRAREPMEVGLWEHRALSLSAFYV